MAFNNAPGPDFLWVYFIHVEQFDKFVGFFRIHGIVWAFGSAGEVPHVKLGNSVEIMA